MIDVTIPLPPSVNSIWMRTRTGIARSKKYQQWIKDAGWTVKAARVNPLECEQYTAAIEVAETMRGDVDGRIKAVLDVFVSLGLTPDDRFADSVSVRRSAAIAPGTCRVMLTKVEDAK